MDEKISEANFTIYAAKLYESPILDTSEFYEDLKRFSYIKRLLNQYEKTGVLKQNLIILNSGQNNRKNLMMKKMNCIYTGAPAMSGHCLERQ